MDADEFTKSLFHEILLKKTDIPCVSMSSELTLPAGQGGVAGEQLPANDEADREDPEKGDDYVSKALEPTDPTKLWNGTDGTNIGNAETKRIQR